MTSPGGKFELISFTTADELARAAAAAWLEEIEKDNRAGKLHCVALSGGRITKNLFASVVELNKARKVSFGGVHFFWADERCVPPDDPESNFKTANELLFAPLEIPENQIHRIRGEELPEVAARLATEEMRRVVSNCKRERDRPGRSSARPRAEHLAKEKPLTRTSAAAPETGALPVLDLVFLGMGEDGHVASLFPHAPAEIVSCPGPFLFIEKSPKPPPRRISLSYAAVTAAGQVWVLISGAGKEKALRESLDFSGKTPLAKVIQLRQKTLIFSQIRPN